MTREIKRQYNDKPNATSFKPGHVGYSGAANGQWKGDRVGYTALHEWLYLRLGKPSECENCGATDKTKYEWANLSGEYKRDISDWARLCVSCHRLIDGHGYKLWATRRAQNA